MRPLFDTVSKSKTEPELDCLSDVNYSVSENEYSMEIGNAISRIE